MRALPLVRDEVAYLFVFSIGIDSLPRMINLTHHPTRVRPGHHESVSSGLMPCGQPCCRTGDRRMLLVLMMVGDDMRRHLLMADIARTVNLSPGRLAHLFKSEIGVSPQRYLNNIRLDKARECLENGVLSVKEIAAEVGIPTVSRLCRSFKARYGTTPKEYRKTHLRLDLESVAPGLRACQNVTPRV